jgi:hypothetical protein
MTFYNIIFGLLFIGAIREVYASIVEGDLLKFLMALSIAVSVFNDVLYTSHYIEKDTAVYTVQMKLLDLLNFLVLGASLVILSPRQNGFYDSNISVNIKLPAGLFWGLLVVYWMLTLWWNRLAEKASKTRNHKRILIFRLIFLFPLLACFASLTPWPLLQIVVSIICAVALFAYMTICKLREEKREKREKRRPRMCPFGRCAWERKNF